MDIVHHAAIGGIGALALASRDLEVAALAFVAASVLPDLDIAFMVGGKRAYLRNHQGPTHSLVASPLLAAAVALPLTLLLPSSSVMVWSCAVAGVGIHLVLDLCNTFGIALLWPLSRRRFCLDGVFFIDLPLWTMTLGAGVASYALDGGWTIWVYATAFASYVGLKFVGRIRVQRRLRCALAIPSSWHPWRYFILEDTSDGGIRTYLYDALTHARRDEERFEKVPARWRELASKSAVFRDLQRITRRFWITAVESSSDGTTIRARDLGIRNFGGRFGRTTLTFDTEDHLIDEVADI